MDKKKILKIILIIITIIFIIFLIRTVRNYIIITDLQNKISAYANSNNHNIKIITTENNGTVIKVDYYKKDNKKVVFLEREMNGEKTKLSKIEAYLEQANAVLRVFEEYDAQIDDLIYKKCNFDGQIVKNEENIAVFEDLLSKIYALKAERK